ncbi:methyltransferase [Nonomuraea sp. CA-218870]|uniref:Methyltransferase n=1 Tax=Nonomuraea corallina TaxID=2989783 RepID=A0ABT4SB39_9ACTN|nr:methyltransferase [Nonomuraea corallina]MDA0634367.1 methyltransferase [Nonomuraea corallina]
MTLHQHPDALTFSLVDPYQHIQKMLDAVPDFAALHAAVELDVFEALATQTVTSDELADACGADPDAMNRLLGWLHARGFVADSSAGYRLTELGHVLTAEADPSQRHAVLVAGSTYWWNAIGRLAHTIRRGQPTQLEGQPVYEYLACTPGLAEQFDRFMTARSTAVGRDLASLDGWAEVRLVADLGGGLGGVLAALVHAHPHLRGVLAERPGVTARAHAYLKEQGLLGRVEIVAADIFEEIPRGAQRYLLSSILHNYSDEACVSLLTEVRHALQDNAGGQVWIVEGLLPRRTSTPSPWYATDIRMMSLFQGGQVRRASQLRRLARQAGQTIVHATPLPCGQTVLAARPARGHES